MDRARGIGSREVATVSRHDPIDTYARQVGDSRLLVGLTGKKTGSRGAARGKAPRQDTTASS